MPLELTSPAFESGTMIPSEYTCDGKNISPPLTLSGIPQQAASLVLICDDPDAPPGPNGPFTHWLLYDLSPKLKEIPQGFSPTGRKSQKGMAGRNSFGNYTYEGPCSSGEKIHRYVFRVYALQGDPDLPPNADREQVLQGIKEHILEQAIHLGQYVSKN